LPGSGDSLAQMDDGESDFDTSEFASTGVERLVWPWSKLMRSIDQRRLSSHRDDSNLPKHGGMTSRL